MSHRYFVVEARHPAVGVFPGGVVESESLGFLRGFGGFWRGRWRLGFLGFVMGGPEEWKGC